MPMVATSPSIRSHSWSGVNSVVMKNPLAVASSTFVGVGNEGHRRYLQRQPLAAHLGKYGGTEGCVRRRQIAHRDRRIEAGAESARGDLADRLSGSGVRKQRRALAHRRTAFGFQADPAARRTLLKLRQDEVRAGKTAGAHAAGAAALLNGPFQRTLDRAGRGVDIVAV